MPIAYAARGKSEEGAQMRVGVPKEIKTHEYRVGLTPGAVREYVARRARR